MNVTLYVTLSMNGYIADLDGNEDFFQEDNWNVFKNLAIKNQNIIWGRKTYEKVLSWGETYIKDFDSIKIIIVSKTMHGKPANNIDICKSPKEALDILYNYNIKNAFVSGGTELYSSFLREKLVNDLIINYNMIAIPEGKKIFDNTINTTQFKLIKTTVLSDNILQIKMTMEK